MTTPPPLQSHYTLIVATDHAAAEALVQALAMTGLIINSSIMTPFEATEQAFKDSEADFVVLSASLSFSTRVNLLKHARHLPTLVALRPEDADARARFLVAGAQECINERDNDGASLRRAVLDSMARHRARRRSVAGHVRQVEQLALAGQMAANLAHEINNPCTFIKANLEYLQAHIVGWTPFIEGLKDIAARSPTSPTGQVCARHADLLDLDDLTEVVDECRQGIERINKHLDQTRSMARLQSDTRDQFVDLNQAARWATQLVEMHLKNADLLLDLGEDLPVIFGRYGQLAQVITALLDNAVNAIMNAPRNGHTITVRTRHDAQHVILEVIDTGAEASNKRLSVEFDEGLNGITKEQKMHIVVAAQIIHEHRGDLGFSISSRQEGVARVRFPIAHDAGH